MFVQNLNIQQQGILLSFAKKIIEADGKIEDQEVLILNTLKSHMHPNVEPFNSPIEKVRSFFPEIGSQSTLLIELFGVAYADEHYHAAETDIINLLAEALGVSANRVQKMSEWVKQQFILVREATAFFHPE